jgi:cobalt-zinc-cadmium efflux system protein
MEAAPASIDVDRLQKDLSALPGVKEVHDLHIWSVSSTRSALSVHIISDNPNKTLNDAHRLIEEKHKIHHMTIQVEDPAHFEPKFCYDRINNN